MTEDAAIQSLSDIEDIKRLKGRYCLCVATRDWTTFETLFAEDLEFITPNGTTHSPLSAFMAFHETHIQKTKLWGVIRCHTPIITITSADTATGIWGLDDTHVWPGDGPRVGHRGYGTYYEQYVRLPDGWRFQQIKVVFDRMEPLEGGFGTVPQANAV